MTEPRTEAGRALLDELMESPLDGARYAHHVVEQRLAAIEDQAAQAARAEIAENGERDERERDIAFRAAKMSRTSPDDIRAAIEALRGPMDRNEAIAIGCAYAVLWAHEEVARLIEG